MTFKTLFKDAATETADRGVRASNGTGLMFMPLAENFEETLEAGAIVRLRRPGFAPLVSTVIRAYFEPEFGIYHRRNFGGGLQEVLLFGAFEDEAPLAELTENEDLEIDVLTPAHF